MLQDFDVDSVKDEQARRVIAALLNLVEQLQAENRALRDDNQRLRDENNRLKGEQGKPKLPPKPQPAPAANHSSEKERQQPKPRTQAAKLPRIPITRTEVLRVDPAILPPDAQNKGLEEYVVQDVILQVDNIRFLREKYYSPSMHQTYLAPLPEGYEGDYGPGLKALALHLSFGANVSEAKIGQLFSNIGVLISRGGLSNLLVKNQELFHTERAEVYAAGLASSPWHNLDDTSTRVNGVTHYCQIVCNPLYTAYTTTATKSRLAVLGALCDGRPLEYLLNAEAFSYLQAVGASAKLRQRLQLLPQGEVLTEAIWLVLLESYLPDLGPQQRTWVMEAAAVAAYHAQREHPVVAMLLCDDAPQFRALAKELALCWVHEGRHYKKITPYFAHHRTLLENFQKDFWSYYHELLAYQVAPQPEERLRLSAEFDRLFTTVTGYDILDDRIALTLAKKENLLKVLVHPEIPLHNNPAELGARGRVRKRAVSFGPRTEDGRRAWDTFATLAATCAKLGISFYEYLRDRICRAGKIPRLAAVITERAAQLDLAASWGGP